MNRHTALLVAFGVVSAFVSVACHPSGGQGGSGGDAGSSGTANGGQGGTIANGGAGGSGGEGGSIGGMGGAGGEGGSSPPSGRLMGFGWDAGASVWHSLQIDVSTGGVVDLAALPPQYDSFAQGTGTFDRLSKQIFEITGNNTLLGIDAATGVLKSAAPLALEGYSGVVNLEVNNVGQIIGLAWNTNALQFEVVRIDALTGGLVSLASLPPQYDSLAQGTGTFDTLSNKIFEIATDNTLLVIDGTSGALNDAVPIVLNGYSGVINLEVNNVGEVLGLAWNTNALQFEVVRIDLVTGAAVSLASLPKQYDSMAQGTGTFDSLSNQIIQMAGNNTLLVIDGASGALNAATPIVLSGYSGIVNMEYVP